MQPTLVVVDDLKDWKPYYPSEDVVSAVDYLFGDYRKLPNGTRVINLCRSYRYLSVGYYCSLLAEARRHRVIPTVRTINDLAYKAVYGIETANFDELLQKPMLQSEASRGERQTLSIFFGESLDPKLADLGRQVFDAFGAPLLQVELRYQQDQWRISGLKTLSLPSLDDTQQDAFAAALEKFARDVWRRPRARRRSRYDLAILHDPVEQPAPSNPRALKNFQRVGRSMGIDVDLITKRDYGRLGEYDALLIRETTAVSNHTYRFSKKAESEGMVVIDDPDSILRCTNKVFLSDLLETNDVPRPAGYVLFKGRPQDLSVAAETLGFPLVLKIPDGSFSRGVVRVDKEDGLETAAAALFRQSDLILAQEFVTSDYDWRIGMLGGRAIYACQYYFPKGHWQIVDYARGGREGASHATAVSDTPREVVRAAVKAAGLIGNGLYGVDVKQSGKRVVVIEVNDNPSIDASVEDEYLGDELYRIILEEFVRRLERKRNGEVRV
ncbi:MAG: RimK family protein [Arenicellales bacterium]